MAEIIVALDVRSPDEALKLSDAVPGMRWVKIGPMLLLRGGAPLLGHFKERGVQIFLDLKWHDIPNSVAEAARAAAGLGVDLATVHALGGSRMMMEAVRAAGTMRLAAVTVLTSHGPQEYWSATGRGTPHGALRDEVTRLARSAVEAGCHGVVASPWEIEAVRQVLGSDHWLITPGIRPAGGTADDHRRSAEPAVAVAAGATHLVVGRPIIRAERPREVYESMCQAVS